MRAYFPTLRFRSEIIFFSVLLISGAMVVLSVTGCQSPEGGATAQTSAKPNFAPAMQDVRTEANAIAIENEYNAAKNSQPTHHAEARAESARKAQEKQAREKAAKDSEKSEPAK